jgi:hypothetical protein
MRTVLPDPTPCLMGSRRLSKNEGKKGGYAASLVYIWAVVLRLYFEVRVRLVNSSINRPASFIVLIES